jgi:hypothetical protein
MWMKIWFFPSHQKNLKLVIGSIYIFLQDSLVIIKLIEDK